VKKGDLSRTQVENWHSRCLLRKIEILEPIFYYAVRLMKCRQRTLGNMISIIQFLVNFRGKTIIMKLSRLDGFVISGESEFIQQWSNLIFLRR